MRDTVTIIEPRRGSELLNWKELIAYRELFLLLVWRDIRVRYAQTVLGFGWAILKPVFSMVVFSLIFGVLAAVPSDGVPYPLFSFAALLPWTYFATAYAGSANSLPGNAGLWTKVYFPRLIIPIVPILSGLVDFAIAFVILLLMMAWYGVMPTWNVLFLPLLVILMMVTAAGAGILVSVLAVQYRDIRQATSFIVQLLMYAAPVVWPVSLITQKLPEHGELIRLLYGLYPMAGVVEGFRAALIGTTPMPWDLLGMGAISAAVLLAVSVLLFRQKERIFVDVA